ncbi:unnamed protein product [Amoebophrya sp. A120]|nr:unnamed protein product [Amoebophrya sp. A120]|eukprot:GSA120T00001257001.1
MLSSSRVAAVSLLYPATWLAASFCRPGRVDAVKIRHRAVRADSSDWGSLERPFRLQREAAVAVPDEDVALPEDAVMAANWGRIGSFLCKSKRGDHPGADSRAASRKIRDNHDRQANTDVALRRSTTAFFPGLPDNVVQRDAIFRVQDAAIHGELSWDEFAALPLYIKKSRDVVMHLLKPDGIINTAEKFRALPEEAKRDMRNVLDARSSGALPKAERLAEFELRCVKDLVARRELSLEQFLALPEDAQQDMAYHALRSGIFDLRDDWNALPAVLRLFRGPWDNEGKLLPRDGPEWLAALDQIRTAGCGGPGSPQPRPAS